MANQNLDSFFIEIYNSTHEKVLAYIIAKCGNTEDVADIFQETYTELVSVLKKHGASYIKKPEAFVMQIAKSKIYRHYTLKQRLQTILKTDGYGIDYLEKEVCDEISLEDELIREADVKDVLDFLKHEDEMTKRIFWLYYYMDKKITEIAGILLVSESFVKNRIYRTLKSIRKFLLEKE